jgi:hypothetical protein
MTRRDPFGRRPQKAAIRPRSLPHTEYRDGNTGNGAGGEPAMATKTIVYDGKPETISFKE